MVQYAKVENRYAYLSTDFGIEMARRWFTEEELALVPVITRGKRKGKLRGLIKWKKAAEGGWSRAKGGVVYPGISDVALVWTAQRPGLTPIEETLPSRGRLDQRPPEPRPGYNLMRHSEAYD